MDKNFITNELNFIINIFNQNNINFILVGAIGAYIEAQIPIQRNHDDIDIMILEKDIDKLNNCFKNTNYFFYDNRLNNNKVLNEHNYTDGKHEVYAEYKNSNFHIGVFLYEIDNKEYSLIEYFKNDNITKKLIRTLPIEYFEIQYNLNVYYNNHILKTIRKETIYKNKKVMNREKDLFDINNFANKLNLEILNKMSGLSKIRKTKIFCIQ